MRTCVSPSPPRWHFPSSLNTERGLLPTFLCDTARMNSPRGHPSFKSIWTLPVESREFCGTSAIPWRASGDAWVPRVGLYCITKHHTRKYRIPYILCLSIVRISKILRRSSRVFHRPFLHLCSPWTGIDGHRTEGMFATSGPRWWNTLLVAAGKTARRATQLR